MTTETGPETESLVPAKDFKTSAAEQVYRDLLLKNKRLFINPETKEETFDDSLKNTWRRTSDGRVLTWGDYYRQKAEVLARTLKPDEGKKEINLDEILEKERGLAGLKRFKLIDIHGQIRQRQIQRARKAIPGAEREGPGTPPTRSDRDRREFISPPEPPEAKEEPLVEEEAAKPVDEMEETPEPAAIEKLPEVAEGEPPRVEPLVVSEEEEEPAGMMPLPEPVTEERVAPEERSPERFKRAKLTEIEEKRTPQEKLSAALQRIRRGFGDRVGSKDIRKAPILTEEREEERKKGWGFVSKTCGVVFEAGKKLLKKSEEEGEKLVDSLVSEGERRRKSLEVKAALLKAEIQAIDKRAALEWASSVLTGVGIGAGASLVGAHLGLAPVETTVIKGLAGGLLGVGGFGLRLLGESAESGGIADLVARNEETHPVIAGLAKRLASRVVREDVSRVMMGGGAGLLTETGAEVFLRSIGQLGGWQPQPEAAQVVPTSVPPQTPGPTGAEAPVQPLQPPPPVQPPSVPTPSSIPPSGIEQAVEPIKQVVLGGPTAVSEISQLSQIAQGGMKILEGSNPWRVSENIAQLVMKGSGTAPDKEVLTVLTDAIKDLSGWAGRGEMARAGDLVHFNPSQLAGSLADKIDQIAQVKASGGELKVPVSAEDLASLRKIAEFLKSIKGA